MRIAVAAFYRFTALPDFRRLCEPLRAICADLDLKGVATVLCSTSASHSGRARERGKRLR
jgi:predicted sulfurtransferase